MMKLLRFIFLGTFVVALSSVAVPAEVERWGTVYDELLMDPNSKVVRETLSDGTESRVITLPGNVKVRQQRREGNVSTSVWDESGRGPVLCVQRIYAEVKVRLDTCQELKSPRVSSLLGEAIGQINQFIQKNSIVAVSIERLDAAYQEHLDRYRRQIGIVQPGIANVLCNKIDASGLDFATPFVESINEMSDEEFQSEVDKLLSVPRLPALNPCL